MTVFIYHTTSPNFPSLLTQIQPLLSAEDDIYIVGGADSLAIAEQYGSARCYIFVEVGNYTFEEGLSFAKESMEDNDQEGLLVLDENLIISSTLVQSMKRAARDHHDTYQTFSPVVTHMSPNFKWYARPLQLSPLSQADPRCYYTLASGFNLRPCLIESESVVHLLQKP